MRQATILLAAGALALALFLVSRHLGRAAAGIRAWPALWGFRLLRGLMLLALVEVALGALLLLMEGRFVYFPTRPQGAWDPQSIGAEPCSFLTADGLTLHAVWHPGVGRAAGPRPVILFCHGNAGDISDRVEVLRSLAGCGCAVLIFDYRGYGDSAGTPSEQGLYRDADAAWHYLVEQRGVAPGRIVCFGESLGTAVALHTALERPVAGLVLESAFESIPAMARRQVPWVPVWSLVHNRFDNVDSVGRLAVPLLIVHGDRDGLVPISQARAVYAAARQPKEFYVVRGAAHNDVFLVGGRAYLDTLKRFCLQCLSGADAPAGLPSG
jgi:fermentation-respiration switch protein FrsA (DUF1100 family)